jgi:hypothetical protein
MTRTVLAVLVAVGLVGAAAETAGARRTGDDGEPGRPPVTTQRGDMVGAHRICDCYDFAIPVGTIRQVGTSGGMNGPHIHLE